MASSSGCTALFLNAVPQSTGTISPAMVAARMPRAQVVGGDLLLADVLLEDVLVERGDDVDELVAPVVGVGLQLGRDVDGLVALALALVPDERLHLEQVDDALELVLRADGELDERDRWRRGGP